MAREALGRRGGDPANIHAGMRVKTPVLRSQHGGLKRGRDVGQGHPWKPPAPVVHTLLVDDVTVAIEQIHLGGLP